MAAIDADRREVDRVVARVAWVMAEWLESPRVVFRVETEYSSSSDMPFIACVVVATLWVVLAGGRPREARTEAEAGETVLCCKLDPKIVISAANRGKWRSRAGLFDERGEEAEGAGGGAA